MLAYEGPASHAVISISLLADTETPISAFWKLRAGRSGSALLESVEGGELMGRYSFMVCGVDDRFTFRDGQGRLGTGDAGRAIQVSDPLHVIRDRLQGWQAWSPVDLPRFHGGAIGTLGFDCVRYFETLPLPEADPLGLPEGVLLFADEVFAYDHLAHRLIGMVHAPLASDREAAWRQAHARLQAAVDRLQAGGGPVARPWLLDSDPERLTGGLPALPMRANRSAADMEAAVAEAKQAIVAGEVFQVVISQRLSVDAQVAPMSVYRALRALNPSPYMFFFDFGEFAVVGASPEVLVRVDEGELLVRPIAGTRRRGSDAAEDQALARDLLADEKELAEHRMLVDLGRNDVGRVAATGSVRVERPLHIERYSHVMHMVTDVRGTLAEGLDCYDVFRACFPAGTVSGAPKIRACELLAELEPERRGVYAGAIGYFGVGGDMDTCIAIRSLVIEDQVVHAQAGAGVVYDSVPAREHRECLDKAAAGLRAVQLALALEGEP
jgi:anthranilate synthase component 1